MLSVDQYEHVRAAHRVYGKSVSEIARLTGHSRNTVRKVLLGEFSGYSARRSQPLPVLGPFRTIIDSWLDQDKEVPRKQRHTTARRIYARLVNEHGYGGSESTIRKYVCRAKRDLGLTSGGAVIPLHPELGHEAEVDWGTAVVFLDGQETQTKLFCMRSKGSGKPFLRLYPCERQQAFFDGMIRAFERYGGVFPVLVFDNLASAVKRVLKGKERVEQESFSRFRSWYTFEARFCNPGKGNEKGGVEGLVGFARRNFPVPRGDNLDELNEALLRECLAYDRHKIQGQSETVGELYRQERERLLPLPDYPYNNEESVPAKADKYATVIVDKNRYSVPASYAGRSLRVVRTVERVDIHSGKQLLASHCRLYGNNKWSLNPDHYLDLLKMRPGAFRDARPIREWKKRWEPELHLLLERFQESWGENRDIKEFIEVLLLYRQHPGQEVAQAVRRAVSGGLSSAAGVRHLLEFGHEPAQRFPPLEGDSVESVAAGRRLDLRGTGEPVMKTADIIRVQENLKSLKLVNSARHLEKRVHQAEDRGASYEEFLLDLTDLELQIRQENREKRRLKEARFPLVKLLQSFDFEEAPDLDRRLIGELARGDYIDQNRNVIFLGKSGTGKTHLATALGIEACRRNKRVRFTTACSLANELIEARERTGAFPGS